MKIDIILNEFTTPQEMAELADLADRLGVRALWASSYASMRDPFMSLVPAARAKGRILLGPLAISPFEMHPFKMATAVATLNEMCHGRAIIAVGGGGGVLRGLKIKPHRMVRAVRECVEILKGMAPDTKLDYDGEMYGVRDFQPRWAPTTPPVIYVCASGPQMMHMAAKHADGLMMSDVPLPRMEEAAKNFNKAMADAGKVPGTFGINNFWAWHIKKDKDASIREARRELVWRGVLERWWLEPFLDEADVQLVRDKFNAFRMAFFRRTHGIEGVPDRVIDPLVENLCFSGGLDAIPGVIDKLKAFEKAGLTEIALRVHDDQKEQIELIGAHVVPALS